MFDLTGKVALVAGGAGHLGTPVCEALAEQVGQRRGLQREIFQRQNRRGEPALVIKFRHDVFAERGQFV